MLVARAQDGTGLLGRPLLFPRASHDVQNTGRALHEPYLGVTNGNVGAFQTPQSRTGSFDVDGWAFPRDAARAAVAGAFTTRPYAVLDNFPLGVQQPPANERGQRFGGSVAADAGWARIQEQEGLTSVEPYNATEAIPSYHRIRAQDRETANVPDAFFTWSLAQNGVSTVPGPVDTVVRFAIQVYVPSPNPSPTADPATVETRITDAEYLVDCDAGTIRARASQVGGGFRTLTDAAGNVLYFPFRVGAPANRSRVRLSAKTSNEITATTYVIADAVQFIQQFDAVQATPTVTDRHGGRRVGGTYSALGQQPAQTDNYLTGAFTGYDPATNAIGIQAGETPGDFSVLYQGPESFIRRLLANGAPAVAPRRAENNNVYGVADPDPQYAAQGGIRPTPIFSQMQVVVARTEYVPDPTDANNDGRLDNPTGSIAVGSVYAFDWLTGAPLWRFPDRTYLPRGGVAGLAQNSATNPQTNPQQYAAGIRNDIVQVAAGPGGAALAQPAVPGIGAIDRNGDDAIDDDEVYIVGAGVNRRTPTRIANPRPGQPLNLPADEVLGTTSGALLGSVTFVPDVVVEGAVALPTGNPDATGRYYSTDATGNTQPVVRPVAYVAANNGVVYAFDPYGNNDNRYFPPTAAQVAADATAVGTFRPGTTNLLWTFNAVSGAQKRVRDENSPPESDREFNLRQKGEVPATAGFGASSPTVAYSRPATVAAPIDPLAEDNDVARRQRLFVGNENGYLYALDTRAVNADVVNGVRRVFALPIRKGDVSPAAPGDRTAPRAPANVFSQELRWWFETRGAITGTPAVSQSQTDAGGNLINEPPIVRRGVYVTTGEGRVYCVDWNGPTRKDDNANRHIVTLNWDGAAGTSAARLLNDGYRFRNSQPTPPRDLPDDPQLPARRPDDTDGTVRPRWCFPQRYVDIDANDNTITNTDRADRINDRLLAPPASLGRFAGSATLMEFSARTPAGAVVPVRYVVVAANDPTSTTTTNGKVYLLDMAGNRASFQTNPTENAARRIIAQPYDRFSLGAPVGTATPSFTYRFLYGDDAGNNNLTNLLTTDTFPVTRAAAVVPSRRLLPTIFVGGVGRLWALDLDLGTAVFTRWPENAADIPGPKPRVNGLLQTDMIPPDLTAADVAALGPATKPNADLAAPDLTRPVLARTTDLPGDPDGAVSGITITGGPLQPRGAAPAGQTTYPPFPTNDPAGYDRNPNATQVEQNILDPLTQDQPPTTATTNNVNELEVGFQYPALWVSTTRGQLHEVSSNIEGEDRTTEADPFFAESSALGWAYTTDPDRKNDLHVDLDRFVGPGGAAPPAIVSNIYYEGLDPNFRNPRYDPAVAGSSPYPTGQPPLKPRPLRDVQPAAGGFPLIPADDSTGDTGFPLDGNGLFYDADSADADGTGNRAGTVIPPRDNGLGTAQNNPDDNPFGTNVVWIYSGGPDGVLYAFTPVRAGTSTGGAAGQRPGGRLNPRNFPNLNGDPKVDIFDREDFDALRTRAQGGPGTALRPDRDGSVGNGGPLSRAAKGKNNFFEWGETVYIVAYDLNAVPDPASGTVNAEQPIALSYNTGPGSVVLTITTSTGQRVTRTATIEPGTYRGNNPRFFGQPGAVGQPPFDQSISFGLAFFAVQLGASDAQNPQTPGRPLQVSVAQTINQKVLDANGNVQGSRRTTSTGRFVNGGPNSRAIQTYLQPQFVIANPIAAEGFFTDTQGRPFATIFGSDNQPKNGIGPFFNGIRGVTGTGEPDDSDDAIDKSRVFPQPLGTPSLTPAPGTQDPDRTDFQYSQALANGNLIQRIDLRPYTNASPGTGLNGQPPRRNPSRNVRVANDPAFYIPVAAGTGYVSHGANGSTDQGSNVHNLRVFNRSRLNGLPGIRIARDELLWRYWPGQLPNADADAALNPRRYPAGMSATGAINPLPWEEAPQENKPWKAGGATAVNTTGEVAPTANSSQDYPNVSQSQISAAVGRGGSDPVAGPATLPLRGGKAGVGSAQPQTFGLRGTTLGDLALSLDVNVRVPAHQPANLVATGNVTGTYVGPNQADGAGAAALASGQEGPVQLPRGVAVRTIRVDPTGNRNTIASNPATLVPWGYTTRLLVYVDSNSNGRLDLGNAGSNPNLAASGFNPNNPGINAQSDIEEAYREVEVWVGVPADIRLGRVEQTIDLSAPLGLPHGFGAQNGLLGYNPGGNAPLNLGFAPPPLFDLTLFSGAGPYDPFFKTFNVRNDGNVNLWNVRTASRAAVLQRDLNGALNFAESPLQLRSSVVDPRFFLWSVGKDPLVNAAGAVPNLVTSLDLPYDGEWNTRTLAAGYPLDYRRFSGRHTAHKARVGDPRGTLLSLPDSPGNAPVPPGLVFAPRLGVSVPIGTPSGPYTGSLFFFEDHDTPNPNTLARDAEQPEAYRPAPILLGDGSIAPAGPLYGRRNDVHPGDRESVPTPFDIGSATRPLAARPILPAGAEGIWRPRRAVRGSGANANRPVPEYQPATNPATVVKATVVESPLTGQRPDTAVATTAGGGVPNIVNGLLPFVDPFTLLDPPAAGLDDRQFNNNPVRAAAALAPAAFRSVTTGNLHTYFARNARNGNAITAGDTQPGQPLRLFRSTLNWDEVNGTWKAVNPGAPLALGLEKTSQGRWFSTPETVLTPSSLLANPATNPLDVQNAAPYLLHRVTPGGNGAQQEQATLFWVNTEGVVGGSAINRIMYAPVRDFETGELGAAQTLINPGQFDPALRRANPRAVLMGATNADRDTQNLLVVLFHGGAVGRSSLFYSAAPVSNNSAVPSGNGFSGPEIALPIPAAITSATDATGVARFFPERDPARRNPNQSDWALDVYYSGVSRASGSTDIYMTRYRARGAGGPNNRRVQLDAVALPRVENERLVAPSREPVFVSQHISWLRTPLTTPAGAPNRDELPLLTINFANRGGTPETITLPRAGQNWQYDDATGLLYLTFRRTLPGNPNPTLNTVYADTSAGTIRFRGDGVPTQTDIVRLSYTPQTYRLTQDIAPDVTPIAFVDSTVLPATQNGGTGPRAAFDRDLRRPNGDVATDRLWVVWQKGAQPNLPASLYYSTRRVGIDLKAVGAMNPNESIELGPRDNATGNQEIAITVTGPGGTIPFDVDFVSGRVFFPSEYDGLTVGPAGDIRIQVAFVTIENGVRTDRRPDAGRVEIGPTPPAPPFRLGYINDTASVTDGASAPLGRLLTSRLAINEGQPFAFLDRFDGLSLLPEAQQQARRIDPTLQPGRVWLFWTSPRNRTYDVYWETLAPNFSPLSFSGLGNIGP